MVRAWYHEGRDCDLSRVAPGPGPQQQFVDMTEVRRRTGLIVHEASVGCRNASLSP